MGYTHYFTCKKQPSQTQTTKIKQIVLSLLKTMPCFKKELLLMDNVLDDDELITEVQPLNENIFDLSDIIIADWSGEAVLESPEDVFVVEEGIDCLLFNGLEDDAHETFFLPMGFANELLEKSQDVFFLPEELVNKVIPDFVHEFNFCKTDNKPYDFIVCAVLLVVKIIAPECYEIKSDGKDDDWLPSWNWVVSELKNMPDASSLLEKEWKEIETWS